MNAKRVAVILGLVAGLARPALATTIFVNATADDTTTNGNCTLREALLAANTNVIRDGCPAGSAGTDDIRFAIDGTFVLSISGPDDVGLSGDLDVFESVNIFGNGVANTVIDASGLSPGDRAIHVRIPGAGQTVNLVMTNLKVTGGALPEDGPLGGAGIFVDATLGTSNLTLDTVTVSGNQGSGRAAALRKGPPRR